MTKIYGVFINRALSFIFGGFSSVMAIARSCFGCLESIILRDIFYSWCWDFYMIRHGIFEEHNSRVE